MSKYHAGIDDWHTKDQTSGPGTAETDLFCSDWARTMDRLKTPSPCLSMNAHQPTIFKDHPPIPSTRKML